MRVEPIRCVIASREYAERNLRPCVRMGSSGHDRLNSSFGRYMRIRVIYTRKEEDKFPRAGQAKSAQNSAQFAGMDHAVFVTAVT